MKENSVYYDSSWKFRLRAWNSSFSIVILVGIQSSSGSREIIFFNGVDFVFLSTGWLTGLRISEVSSEDLLSRFPQLAEANQAGKRGFVLDSENFNGLIFGSHPRRKYLPPGQTFEEALSRDLLSDVLRSDDET